MGYNVELYVMPDGFDTNGLLTYIIILVVSLIIYEVVRIIIEHEKLTKYKAELYILENEKRKASIKKNKKRDDELDNVKDMPSKYDYDI